MPKPTRANAALTLDIDKIGDYLVNAGGLGRLLGISPISIQNKVATRDLPAPVAPGRWLLLGAIHAALAGAAGRKDRGTYNDARTRNILEKNEILVLKKQEITGELLKADNVIKYTTGVLLDFKTRIMGVPAKAALRLAQAKDAAQAEAILQEELAEAVAVLERLADTAAMARGDVWSTSLEAVDAVDEGGAEAASETDD